MPSKRNKSRQENVVDTHRRETSNKQLMEHLKFTNQAEYEKRLKLRDYNNRYYRQRQIANQVQEQEYKDDK